jgi:hypothetical protein
VAKKSRDKGARGEREIVNILIGEGYKAKRTAPLQTYQKNDAPDILVETEKGNVSIEVKLRANGFKQIYQWLANNNALIIKSDRKEPLIIQPLKDVLKKNNL